MQLIKKYNPQIVFYLLLYLVIAIFITFSSYVHLPLSTPKDYLYYGLHFLLLQFIVVSFFYILSRCKWSFYLIFPPLFLIFSLFAFWTYTMDISPTPAIIQASLESKPDIIIDLISIPLIIYVFFSLLALFVLLRYYKKHDMHRQDRYFFILSFIGISLFFITEKYRYNTLKSRMPFNLVYGIYEYAFVPNMEIDTIHGKLTAEMEKDLKIILVLGESLRADHLHINGYVRQTTPHLDTMKNLISLPYVYTPLTYTGISLPQILTDQSVKDTLTTHPLYSIYTVANKIGLQSVWIGNQTPEKSYVSFIEENSRTVLIDSLHNIYSFTKKRDEALLPFFNKYYRQNKYQLLTLHTIGSHWWYENRYTPRFRKFTPVIQSKYIPSNTKEEMINSYDNTVLYFDDFMYSLINSMPKNDTILLIYLSDHGENLGENNIWLHAQNGKAAKNPAVLIWYSDKFAEKYPNEIEKIRHKAGESLSTDFLYPTILDLFKLIDFDYPKKQSLLN